MAEVLGTALLNGLIGLAVLLVLWPTRSGGRRFLRRWGVPEPDDQQELQAVRYLRDRRLLYPLLFLIIPAGQRMLGLPYPDSSAVRNLAPVIVALLLAEAVAALRPVRGVRVATLARRRWRDLVPRSAMVTFLALGGLAVLFAVIGLLARPWAERSVAMVQADDVLSSVSDRYRAEMAQPVGWIVLIGVVLGLVAVLGVVRLAVRRGSVADPLVDAALRRRSARVAVGIGIAWMGSMVLPVNNYLGLLRGTAGLRPPSSPMPGWLEYTSFVNLVGPLVFLVAVLGWIFVANPSARRTAE
ncbi:hypothetical protein [Saccharothrix deserti]|uniref:hypothetical protein n=1 Tax=Saccharothrix deserti TaxID=2593674 RepID=UPI001EE44146|nr:hypothetical protein [Saccharothrix deserti]